jgi:hypothetical protein
VFVVFVVLNPRKQPNLGSILLVAHRLSDFVSSARIVNAVSNLALAIGITSSNSR